MKITEAFDKTGVLFCANVLGRVGLQQTIVDKGQLTRQVEVDFFNLSGANALVLIDGVHHAEGQQVVRDYGLDRMLPRSGVATVRFTAKNCTERPESSTSKLA